MNTAMIYGKISSIMKEIEAIAKDKENKAQGFKFRGIDDIYNEVHPRLAKHGVFSVTKVLEERREERQTKSGGIMTHSIMKISFTFYAEDGSSIESIMIGEGADTGDKASNKAMAIAHKYSIMQLFAIPTKDAPDPDSDAAEFKAMKDAKKKQSASSSSGAIGSAPPSGLIHKPINGRANGGKFVEPNPEQDPRAFVITFGPHYLNKPIGRILRYNLTQLIAFHEKLAQSQGKPTPHNVEVLKFKFERLLKEFPNYDKQNKP